MYSIFGTKTRKHNYLEEGEPPPKKIVAEENILIKKLVENQLKTDIALDDQLTKEKEFTSSKLFTNITSHISGKTTLKDFQTGVTNVDERTKLLNGGLSTKDIELYQDFTNLGPEFWNKYKSISKDGLCKQINEIKKLVSQMEESSNRVSSPATFEHKEGCQNSTKLVAFATRKEPKKEYLPGPMDELPNLEKHFMENLEEYSHCDIKKIRKKARSMGNKIKNLETVKNIKTDDCSKSSLTHINSERPTLWDVREKPTNVEKKIELRDKNKVYTCKPQFWYTIRDGKIIKLDENQSTLTNSDEQKYTEKEKLTLEEIKNIPKFSNYSRGTSSNTLYLKNLGKNVTENCIKNLLRSFEEQSYSVKCLNGKMRGQAFIEFKDIPQASQALEILNGTILEGKPIIVQYGRKKDT